MATILPHTYTEVTSDSSGISTSVTTTIGQILVAEATTDVVSGLAKTRFIPATAALTASVGSIAASQFIGLGSFAKAALPTATAAGQVIYVSDATALHGTGSLAFSRAAGTTWIDATTSVTVV